MPWFLLIPGFLLVALLYAAAGFGGGSTYNALLVLAGTEYQVIPVIALTCNIIVVSGGVWHFSRAGHFSWTSLAPFATASIPMAWLGGRLPVSETVFAGLLGLALLVTALHLFLPGLRRPEARLSAYRNRWSLGLVAGSSIGVLSGVVGIGGGIFLAPLLYLFNYASPRRIAAMASGFILVNSVAGLLGQLMKLGVPEIQGTWLNYWPLYVAVFIGGQLGSRWGALRLSETWVRLLTGVLVLYVAIRLLFRWSALAFA
jgi:uncharacterized membrane protein YfcA